MDRSVPGCQRRSHAGECTAWTVEGGGRSLDVGRWSLVVGRWSLVVGRWSLERAYSLLTASSDPPTNVHLPSTPSARLLASRQLAFTRRGPWRGGWLLSAWRLRGRRRSR